MNPQVEVISAEMVKPSSPTPQHLRRYNLSFLDQITPQVNHAMVYYFDSAKEFNTIDVSDRLKKSLSQALTYYYPLAGRLITKDLIIDCNDNGSLFVETKVKCHLSHVADNPSPADVCKFLPYEMDEPVDTVLGVQFNVFDCGGIAIGVCMSHKVADALSFLQFVKSWAAVTSGEPEHHMMTHFQSSTLFPPKNLRGYDPDSLIAKDKIVCKRFVFEASAIESLRSKYSEKMTNSAEGQKPPSRVEVLSTFIWTRFLAATKEEEEEEERNKKIQLVAWTANLRPRMDPPLPEYAFGNYYWVMRTLPTLDEQGNCHDLGRKLREELDKIDNHFIANVEECEEWNPNQKKEEMVRSSEGDKRELVAFGFTSLCRFPVYDVDFGWGNPTWVGPPTWKFKNVVTLKDTKSGGGIEAYASFTEEDMARFEHDEQFLAYVARGQNDVI